MLAVVVVGLVVVHNGGSPAHRTPSAAAPLRSPGPTTTPTTTAPAPTTVPPAVSLVSSSADGSIFSLRDGATITFTATAASWAELRAGGPSGSVVYEGTLEPGQVEHLSGSSWVRLGNPTGVTVDVDGTPVVAPSLADGRPTDLQFT